MIETEEYISREEMVELIRGLSIEDLRQLGKVASYYGNWVKGWTANDILHEALIRASRSDSDIKKRRRCKRGENLIKFFASAMKSIVSSEGKKSDNSKRQVQASTDGAESAIDIPDNRPQQDDQLVQQDIISQIEELFSDDEIAQIIVQGLGEGMRGKELKELTELDEKAYQSKRTLIKRRLKKAFPDGLEGVML